MKQTLDETLPALPEASALGALARGQVYQLAGYFSEAIESYTEALALNRELDEAAARLTIVQLLAGEHGKALANAMKLAARSPAFQLQENTSDQHIGVMTLLGDALAFNGRSSDAIKAYELALANKRDTFAAGRLAQLHLASGQPGKALEQLAAASGNTRFRNLTRVLSLGRQSEALLPVIEPRALTAELSNAMPGRPLMIEATARTAPPAWGDTQWSD